MTFRPSRRSRRSLRLSALTGDEALRAKVLAQVQPWLSGDKPLLGDRIQLTTVAGTMVFAELAKADRRREYNISTAMILTAMARGVRLGWIDRSYAPVVSRAWRALSAHIVEDGGLVDVCSGTGAGPTARYYFDRPAIAGADDRGGAMALVAAMERLARSPSE